MKKRQWLAMLVAVSFLLLIGSSIFYLEKMREARRIDPLEMESLSKEQIIQSLYSHQAKTPSSSYYLIPIFGFFGLAVGALVYFLLTDELERKDKEIISNFQVILNLLGQDERKVVRKIAQSGGKVQQLEITYLEGFTKVKAHRIVESLAEKGVLKKEKMGKARLITMDPELYMLLKHIKEPKSPTPHQGGKQDPVVQ